MGNSQRFPQHQFKDVRDHSDAPTKGSEDRFDGYNIQERCPNLPACHLQWSSPTGTSIELGHLILLGWLWGWTPELQPSLSLSGVTSAVILLRKWISRGTCLIQSFLFCKSKSQVSASDWWRLNHMPALNCKGGWESELLISASGMQVS